MLYLTFKRYEFVSTEDINHNNEWGSYFPHKQIFYREVVDHEDVLNAPQAVDHIQKFLNNHFGIVQVCSHSKKLLVNKHNMTEYFERFLSEDTILKVLK